MKKNILLLLLLFITLTAYAYSIVPFGSGTQEDPYRIATESNLLWASQKCRISAQPYPAVALSEHYIQTADIELTSANFYEWQAYSATILGNEENGGYDSFFKGSYDGQGFSISGSRLDRSTIPASTVGGTGFARGNQGVIKNLNLVNVDVKGTYRTGGLAGMNTGLIENCSVSGTVRGATTTGGLVGENRNTIIYISSSAAVIGTGEVGGLVGNGSSIKFSYATGTVAGIETVGGLSGYYNWYDAPIENCYSRAAVSRNSGSTNDWVASFSNYNGSIKQCYATGSVVYTGTTNPVNKGFNTIDPITPGSVVNNFFDSQSTQQNSGLGATAKTTVQMKDAATYANYDFVKVWGISSTINDGYPHLKKLPLVRTSDITFISNTSVVAGGDVVLDGYSEITTRGVVWSTTLNPTIESNLGMITSGSGSGVFSESLTALIPNTTYFARAYAVNAAGISYGINQRFTAAPIPAVLPAGTGTAADPYLIADLNNLCWLSVHPEHWDKYYLQTADIDASSTSSWYNGEGWNPLGTVISIGDYIHPDYSKVFRGSYNGQGYTIDGLHINRYVAFVGFFGFTKGANLQSIGLANVDITGKGYVGALAGYILDGQVQSCYTTGSVNGNYTTGGLAGEFASEQNTASSIYSIKDCYSRCVITRENGSTDSKFGSFIGNKYSNSSYPVSVSNCYSTGNIVYLGTSNPVDKGFVGSNTNTNIIFSNNFFDSESSGQTSGTGAFAKTTMEMKTPATFNNWALGTVWNLTTSINDGYPSLLRLESVTTAEVSNITINSAVCGGSAFAESGYTISDKGIVWSLTANPTITVNQGKVSMGAGSGVFTCDITGLAYSTAYYVRAYTTNESITRYGEQKIFWTTALGTGSEADPYRISSLNDLRWLSETPACQNKFFMQTVNIDASPTVGWNSGSGWKSIENFTGVYNGNGFTVNGIYINRSSNSAGFFKNIDHGIVKDLGLTALDVRSYNMGGLACSSNNSKIENCYTSGSVLINNTSSLYVGGLIGQSSNDSISRCYSSATITLKNEDGDDEELGGGLIGVSSSLIENCYTTGVVAFPFSTVFTCLNGGTSGLVGKNLGIIKNCYSARSVTSGFDQHLRAGLTPNNPLNTVVSSYFDIDLDVPEGNSNELGRTTAQMKTQSTYIDWDFSNIWVLNSAINNGYPSLKVPTPSAISTNLMPSETKLFNNYPNPFNPATTIKFDLQTSGLTKLVVYNTKGELVKTLVNGMQNAGRYSVSFDGSGYNSGVYFYKLEADGKSIVIKMIMLK